MKHPPYVHRCLTEDEMKNFFLLLKLYFICYYTRCINDVFSERHSIIPRALLSSATDLTWSCKWKLITLSILLWDLEGYIKVRHMSLPLRLSLCDSGYLRSVKIENWHDMHVTSYYSKT